MDIHLVVFTVQLFMEARGRTPVGGGGDGDDTNSGAFGDDTTTSGGDHFDNDGDNTNSGGFSVGDDANSGCFGDGDDTTTSGGDHFDNDGDDTNSGGFGVGGDTTTSGRDHFDNDAEDNNSGCGDRDDTNSGCADFDDGDNTNSGGDFHNSNDTYSGGNFDDGDDTNSDCSGRYLGNKTPSPEPLERGNRTFHQRNHDEQLRRSADMTSDGRTFHHYEEQLRRSADMISDGNRMLEVVDHASGHLAAGFLSSNASYISQTQGGDHLSIDMPPHEQVPARQPPAPVELIRAILSMSLMTLVPAISTALYRPPRGVVFGQNKLSYYLALSVIFSSGLGEAFTAFWLSRPGGGSQPCLTFGRAVLCASVLPFAAVLGIAGYGFIQG